MIKHQGGCHCGNVRYTTTYDPMMVMACHCTTCTKISGAGMTVSAVFGEGEVDFEGDIKTFPYRGESGNCVHQGFCSNCGNNIVGHPEILAKGAPTQNAHLPAKIDVFEQNKQTTHLKSMFLSRNINFE